MVLRKILFRKLIPMTCGLIIVAIAIWAAITPTPLIRHFFVRIDYLLFDARLRAMLNIKKEKKESPIVIVDIDEKSLQAEGRWPWPRDRVAELITKLREQGALVIAFDILFAELEGNIADRVSIKLLKNKIDNKEIHATLKQLAPLFDNDVILAKKIKENNDVVLGVIFHNNTNAIRGTFPKPLIKLTDEEAAQVAIISLPAYTSNLPVIQESTNSSGFLTSVRDEDGVVRRTPLLIRYNNMVYPSLALEAARKYLLIDDVGLKFGHIGEAKTVESITLGKQLIPTDARGQVIIPYKGLRGSFRYYSAADVLNDKLKPLELENTLVFVGTSALGLADLQTTPIENIFPGVEIHATVASGILDNYFPYVPDWAKGAQVLLIFISGIFLALVLPFLGPYMLIFICSVVIAGIIGTDIWLWNKDGLILSFSIAISMSIVLAMFNFAYGFVFENRRGRKLKRVFSQYVPPEHVKKISDNPNKSGMEGESREMTVLFADIRNFTSMSEKLEASVLKEILNRYFTPMTEIIFNYEGTIDKYVGDMIMAFWGAPLEDPEHRAHALDAALSMMEASDKLRFEFIRDHLPEINIGIGLNTGHMSVGDMGSKFRRSYTVLGDAVNLGSRIESATKFYGVRIAVGESTIVNQDQFVFRKLDKVKVKGKDQAAEIYELVGRAKTLTQEKAREISEHEIALALYFAQQWEPSKIRFTALANKYPDTAIYRIYLERIENLRHDPPGDDWDGAYQRTEK